MNKTKMFVILKIWRNISHFLSQDLIYVTAYIDLSLIHPSQYPSPICPSLCHPLAHPSVTHLPIPVSPIGLFPPVLPIGQSDYPSIPIGPSQCYLLANPSIPLVHTSVTH